MSFLTAAYLMQTYGPLLTEHELSEVLKLEPGTVRNKRARGELGIPYTHEGKAPRYHAEDVAKHLDAMRDAFAS